MGVSASFIPELFRNFNNNPVFSDRYETMHGEKHALVCGNFDNHSLRAFIKGFLNGSHAKGRVHLNLVILRPMPIDLALKAILSHFHAWVRYFVGSPNNPRDLARTKMKDARAAIVLATPNSTDRDAEDGANIMQAIALKSQKKTLRVVLQLHNFRNKCLINNFPRWAYLANDVVVCMEELKFGLMAYNCMAPGFATLILNLLNIHGAKKISSRPLEPWREEYEYGFRMELHDVGISHEFDNISMRDLSTFTYEKWNIIILAVRCFEPPQMVINPTNMQYVIQGNKMRAIVIAKDYTEALRLQWYCTTCLAHESVERCQCTKPRSSRRQKVTIAKDLALYQQIDQSRRRDFTSEFLAIFEDARARAGPLTSFRHSIDVMFPLSLGSKSISGAGNGGIPPPYNTQHSNPETTTAHRKHASIDLVAPTAGYRSDTATIDRTGSFHWVSDIPLTKATLTPNRATEYDFRRHFLVCVVGTPSGRPLNLENFILPFRFHWQPVQDIVILGDSHLIGPNEWTKLKNLPRIFIVHGDPCSFTDLHAVQLCRSNACVILGDSGGDSSPCTTDQCLQDRKTLLCAMNIRSLLQREFQIVHLTTELRYEKNAHLFSSIDTQQNDYKLPVWFNEPFARGLIFSNSLLYSCLSSLFYNDDVFHFLRVLISGQAADEIEALFAVGNGLQPALENQKSRMTGVNVSLRGFNQPPFSFMASERRRKPLTFGEIFLRCLTCWEILCLGLYRLDSRGFRYVLTNPQPNTVLFSQDMFYCFMSASQRDTPGAWKFGETPRANVRVPTS
ncbi:unnamed protein product [Dicrocoelium dendriticum]|nr:unnamed protein product [Dicrocoelium dendriticum]